MTGTKCIRQVKSWIDDGLRPRAVTRDLDWEFLFRRGGEVKFYTFG